MTISMTYRERFAATIAHQPVDRCPIDLGATPQSSVDHLPLVEALAVYLGIPTEPPVYSRVDARILRQFDVDFRRAGALLGYQTAYEKVISPDEHYDSYGIHHLFDGQYWNIMRGPLQDADLDALHAYTFPDPAAMWEDLDALAEEARFLYEETPYVVVGEHPVFGVLELACWLCGYDDFMMRLAAEPEFAHLLFQKILDFQKAVIAAYYGKLGSYLHVTTSGDDFGTQKGLFLSPAMWREYVKPYMRERIAYTHLFTDAVYLHHSCGAIFDIISDLIDIGVGILNPIQPKAAGMEPTRLKDGYGERITFHGGLDTQAVLPSDDPAQIDAAVEHLITAMHPQADGGYIFAPAHNLQHDVSPAAVVRMYETAHRVCATW